MSTSSLDRLAYQVGRMEREWVGRRGRRGLGRHVPVKIARDVLLEVADVIAEVALHRPVHDPLVSTILDDLDRACRREPRRDYSLQDMRRLRALDAAIAKGGA